MLSAYSRHGCADRTWCAHLPRRPGRLAALGIEQVEVSAVARRLLPPARGETRWGQPGCCTAADTLSRSGRGDPRPPGGGERGQVGCLQAAGRELVGESSRIPAGGLAGTAAYHRVRQRPGDRQPPYRLPGDAEPLRKLPAVRKSAVSSVSVNREPRWRDERAAGARASAWSSSGGTGRSVWWWVFCVLGFVMGS